MFAALVLKVPFPSFKSQINIKKITIIININIASNYTLVYKLFQQLARKFSARRSYCLICIARLSIYAFKWFSYLRYLISNETYEISCLNSRINKIIHTYLSLYTSVCPINLINISMHFVNHRNFENPQLYSNLHLHRGVCQFALHLFNRYVP